MVMEMDGIQSLDRGLEILKLLAEEGRITASAAAERLGVHQSSASRLLMSLQKAGLVRKPDFHSFAPDFGLLSFAGAAMNGFPEVAVCAEACGRLAREQGCSASAATLFRGRLIYLASTSSTPGPSLKLVDDSRFPIYRSSPGLLLSYRLGRESMLSLMEGKLKEDSAADPEGEAARLYSLAESSVSSKGLLDLRGVSGNAYNYALDFETASGRLAFVLFSGSGALEPSKAKTALEAAVKWSLEALSINKSKLTGAAK